MNYCNACGSSFFNVTRCLHNRTRENRFCEIDLFNRTISSRCRWRVVRKAAINAISIIMEDDLGPEHCVGVTGSTWKNNFEWFFAASIKLFAFSLEFRLFFIRAVSTTIFAAVSALSVIKFSEDAILTFHVIIQVFYQNRFATFQRSLPCYATVRFCLVQAILAKAVHGCLCQSIPCVLT